MDVQTTRDRSFFDEVPRWGHLAPITAAAFAGLGVAILLGTLGVAIGITAGASVDPSTVSSVDAGEAAAGMGIGAGVWLILSAIVVGIVAGRVLARSIPADRSDKPLAPALVAWAMGLSMAALIASIGGGGLLSGLGGASSSVAASARSEMRTADERDTASARLTPTETAAAREAAEDAAKAAATAAWFAVAAQLLGLGATLLAAKGRPRVETRESQPKAIYVAPA